MDVIGFYEPTYLWDLFFFFGRWNGCLTQFHPTDIDSGMFVVALWISIFRECVSKDRILRFYAFFYSS